MIKRSILAISVGMLLAYSFVMVAEAAEAPRPRTGATPTPRIKTTITPTPTQKRLAPTPTRTIDNNCQPLYGSETCKQSDQLGIDIRIADPKTGEFVDNILVNDTKPTCGTDVKFIVNANNNGSTPLKNVGVTITLPAEVSFKTANVRLEKNGNVLTRNIGDLQPGQKMTIEFTGTLNDQCAACPIIHVEATAGAEVDEDSTQLCTEQKVLGEKTPSTTKGGQPVYPSPEHVTSSPKSGAEVLALIGLIPTGLAGHLLRRRSR